MASPSETSALLRRKIFAWPGRGFPVFFEILVVVNISTKACVDVSSLA